MKDNDICVFSLTRNKQLVKDVCAKLQIPEGKITVNHFADGEILVEPGESVRGKHVFIIQSTSSPVNDALMEILICLDAIKRASCAEATVIIPYYGYARQDRTAKPRQPITSRLVADLLTAAGANRVVTLDLHAMQIQGFFKIPTDNMSAVEMMGRYFKKKKISDICVVSPDHGGATRARKLAESIGDDLPIAIVDKRRNKPNVAEAMALIGDVKGKNCIIVDDLVDTGGSLMGCINMLKENGANDIYCCATHGVFSNNAIERIKNSQIKEFVITNTIERTPEELEGVNNLKVLSIASLVAAAVKSIHENAPMSSIYDTFTTIE